MKARIEFLRTQDVDLIEVLYRRHMLAVTGDGYTYEFDSGPDDPLPEVGDGDSQCWSELRSMVGSH
jgi:hypothetical protein